MSRLLVIGIDGMDSIQLSNFEKYLPNLRNLKNSCQNIELTSVFPPDSIPAWGSIYTGLNPAEHGVINFVDPNNDEFKINFKDIHNHYRGKTFWDVASEHGKRVCILLPYSIYPPWPVNGVMVCRTLEIVNKGIQLKTFPEEIYNEFNLSDFQVNLFHGFPSKRNLDNFLQSCKDRTISEGELALRFLKGYDADLYFIYFSALDAIQHTFWSYCDKDHPDYPGNNRFQNVIKDFYILIDQIIGSLLNAIPANTASIIMSDHGHGMRPVNLVNINEVLHRAGFLNCNNSTTNPFKDKEKIKKGVSILIDIIGIGNFALKAIDKFPIMKKTLANPNYIDFDNTIAYLSAISGVKSYSEGGILLTDTSSDIDYNEKIESVISTISELKDHDSGEKLVNWVCRRENLYTGKHINKYPDILFELKDGFGVGWNVNGPIKGKSSMSHFQPGSHRRCTPVFLASDLDITSRFGNTLNLTDMKLIILDILNSTNVE